MFRHRPLLVVIALFLAPSSCLAAAPATCVAEPEGSRVSLVKEADLAKEASRRVDHLEKQGFFVAQQVAGPIHLEFLIEQSDNLVCLWLATAQGSAKMELRGPNLSPVLLQGPRDEQELMRHLEAGKYVVDVTALNGTQVHGVIGIKGSAVDHLCDADHDRLIERPADPPRYEWPYLLVKPVGLAADGSAPGQEGTLIVVPNNTGFESVNADMLHDSAVCELHFGAGTGPLAIADGLGAPLLIPLFPRPRSVYLQSLVRDSLNVNEADPKFRRIDHQLIAMIDDARVQLGSEPMHHPVGPRVVMTGFSASGVFTNRFAMLHPERVLAAAAGGLGGWPLAPVRSDQGKMLPYPVGIADLDIKEFGGQPVDLAALKRVRLLFLLGTADTRDAVLCTDSFSDADARLINSLFGEIGGECNEASEPLVKRWWPAQRLYHAAGLNAHFKLYPDVRHEMGMTAVMWSDVLEFFRKAISAR